MHYTTEASEEKDYQQYQISSHNGHLKPLKHEPEAVCEDWQLSDRLCGTLANIFLSREYKSYRHKAQVLDAAIICLRDEVKSLTLTQD